MSVHNLYEIQTVSPRNPPNNSEIIPEFLCEIDTKAEKDEHKSSPHFC